ncbi:MAG: histidinol-phosphate aminotransferase family protein [Magnetococcales bacterium]|nr:histidinol-phosphate aminotransferase family protein [Magnetococcales bacterium]
MRNRFKPHILKVARYQTSAGRDLVNGHRLDRNERVSNFSDAVLADLIGKLPRYLLNVTPDISSLYEAIGRFVGVPRSQLYILNGITEGIKILYETLTNPGENVVVLDPTYPMYNIYSQLYQLEYRKFGYTPEMKPDFDSLWRQIDDKTAAVMIPNPNLPIEAMFTVEQVREIAERCRACGAVLVIDEAYHFFGDVPTMVPLIAEYDHLIVTQTFSKAHGLAGIRLGYMVSNEENISYLSKTRSLVETNGMTQAVAEYCLAHPELLQEHVREVREGSRYVQEQLTQLGIRWHGGNLTNGLLFFLQSKQQSEELVAFMRARKIYIRGAFEPPYDHSARISIGPVPVMQVFVDALKEWLGRGA